ncbi:hypothetical protein [Chelatococcus sp. HY11]|uniref:hypothetical protein n=2 Tax=unclassified Chelatococcus TaxID=2638111 RepID=UPI001BCA6F58|nr:hypothetical protein [Chelatococcus sp. HY11]MBS7738946.1 hypothetical protein [Chelatococcus sp. HY11]
MMMTQDNSQTARPSPRDRDACSIADLVAVWHELERRIAHDEIHGSADDDLVLRYIRFLIAERDDVLSVLSARPAADASEIGTRLTLVAEMAADGGFGAELLDLIDSLGRDFAALAGPNVVFGSAGFPIKLAAQARSQLAAAACQAAEATGIPAGQWPARRKQFRTSLAADLATIYRGAATAMRRAGSSPAAFGSAEPPAAPAPAVRSKAASVPVVYSRLSDADRKRYAEIAAKNAREIGLTDEEWQERRMKHNAPSVADMRMSYCPSYERELIAEDRKILAQGN